MDPSPVHLFHILIHSASTQQIIMVELTVLYESRMEEAHAFKEGKYLDLDMGCTISPILFVMAMEVILKAAEGSAGPANLGGGYSMPPLKAFMDDTTIICSKEDETRRMLTRLDDLMSWCRIKFKPKKSRSLSIRRGKIDEATTFTVAEQQIPTVSQELVKSLGRWYDSSMKDTRRGAETLELTSESLLASNKCGLQGKFKIWCLQFMLIPKLLWPLLVYDICSSTVEAIEAKINKYTRKWLGVPPAQCTAEKQS
ncbi:reverse transcriptase [Plakobranchus ocellatus]|uniref:Reverse transcriptase n=1 Tax=Plakobranchus ocellatus TaxID=259542 RepID=A0AAV3ZUN5_9GAST|nr:reverse transcriptase [Plakobranchus ocellatus]